MTDYTDLKSIAEASLGHQPLRFMRSHGALYIRNDNGIVFDVHQNRSFPDHMAQNKDYADLVLAANPAAVLALIANRDQLFGETERLKAESKELSEFKAEMVSMREANGFDSWAAVLVELDRLKAEVDSLTREADRQYTTIEAYRKNAERYQWLREADWWRSPICVVRNPKEQVKLGSDCPSGERLDEAVDAAMGKGEQS